MKLSARASAIGESATLKVAALAQELKANGVEVADFGAGEPDFDSPGVAVEAAIGALRDGFTRYTPVAGVPKLRAALARRYAERYGAPFEPNQVVLTAGAKAALFEVILATAEDGDEIVLPTPYWVSLPEQIRFAGAEPVLVPCHADDGFRIHADAVLDAIGPATRMVLINSPCNPTGGVIDAADLERVASACAERGILLMSDETYEEFVYDGATHASAAPLANRFPETIVVVGSFSKTYSMTGWRLGFALGPATVMKAVTAIQSHSTSNPTSFAMIGGLAALNEAADDVAAMIGEFAARRTLMVERLNAMPGVRCPQPAGAFYVFPDVTGCFGGGIDGSVALAEHLLGAAHVAAVPGIAFGSDDHLRLSFACSRETLTGGLGRMARALEELAAGVTRATSSS